jgi:hypothetical protein
LPPGIWHSEWTTCQPNPCPHPAGACCSPYWECLYVDADQPCPDGWYFRPAESCEPNPCGGATATEKTSWGRIKALFR